MSATAALGDGPLFSVASTITATWRNYAVGTIGALLVLGRLSNHMGRRLTAIASLGLLLLGSLPSLNVHDIGTLLAGRPTVSRASFTPDGTIISGGKSSP